MPAMRRAVLLLVVVACLGSCARERRSEVPYGPLSGADGAATFDFTGGEPGPTPIDANGWRDYLRQLAELADATKWEPISGRATREHGGWIWGYPRSWGHPRYSFGLLVPPGAIPEGYPSGVTLTINVPARPGLGKNGKPQTLLLRLEPDGLEFDLPITVYGTYAPWLANPSEFYTVFCITELPGVDPRPSYWYSDLMTVEGDPRDPKDPQLQHFSFPTQHFSDWDVENGKPGLLQF